MEPLIQTIHSGAATPAELRIIRQNRIEPSHLLRPVPVVSLGDTATPTAIRIRFSPPANELRKGKAELFERVTGLRMLQQTVAFAHCRQSRFKAAVVIAQLPPHLGRRAAAPVSPPPLARGMGNDGVRASILPGISPFVPRIYPGYIEVRPILLDKESSKHTGSIPARGRGIMSRALVFRGRSPGCLTLGLHGPLQE
jgi:hypothetical protein